MTEEYARTEIEIVRARPGRLPRRDAGPWELRFTRRQDPRNASTDVQYLTQGELISLWQKIGVLFNLAGMRDSSRQETP